MSVHVVERRRRSFDTLVARCHHDLRHGRLPRAQATLKTLDRRSRWQEVDPAVRHELERLRLVLLTQQGRWEKLPHEAGWLQASSGHRSETDRALDRIAAGTAEIISYTHSEDYQLIPNSIETLRSGLRHLAALPQSNGSPFYHPRIHHHLSSADNAVLLVLPHVAEDAQVHSWINERLRTFDGSSSTMSRDGMDFLLSIAERFFEGRWLSISRRYLGIANSRISAFRKASVGSGPEVSFDDVFLARREVLETCLLIAEGRVHIDVPSRLGRIQRNHPWLDHIPRKMGGALPQLVSWLRFRASFDLADTDLVVRRFRSFVREIARSHAAPSSSINEALVELAGQFSMSLDFSTATRIARSITRTKELSLCDRISLCETLCRELPLDLSKNFSRPVIKDLARELDVVAKEKVNPTLAELTLRVAEMAFDYDHTELFRSLSRAAVMQASFRELRFLLRLRVERCRLQGLLDDSTTPNARLLHGAKMVMTFLDLLDGPHQRQPDVEDVLAVVYRLAKQGELIGHAARLQHRITSLATRRKSTPLTTVRILRNLFLLSSHDSASAMSRRALDFVKTFPRLRRLERCFFSDDVLLASEHLLSFPLSRREAKSVAVVMGWRLFTTLHDKDASRGLGKQRRHFVARAERTIQLYRQLGRVRFADRLEELLRW